MPVCRWRPSSRRVPRRRRCSRCSHPRRTGPKRTYAAVPGASSFPDTGAVAQDDEVLPYISATEGAPASSQNTTRPQRSSRRTVSARCRKTGGWRWSPGGGLPPARRLHHPRAVHRCGGRHSPDERRRDRPRPCHLGMAVPRPRLRRPGAATSSLSWHGGTAPGGSAGSSGARSPRAAGNSSPRPVTPGCRSSRRKRGRRSGGSLRPRPPTTT